MSALIQAMSVCERKEGDTTFEDDLAFHLANGMVFGDCDSGQFIMARGVNSKMQELFETYHVFQKDECDAWFVWTAVGDLHILAGLLKSVIEPYQYVIRRAKGKIRIAKTNKILKQNKIYGK